MKFFVQILLMTLTFAIVTIMIGILFSDFTFATIPLSEILYSTTLFFLGCLTTFLIHAIYKKVKSKKRSK